MSHSRLYINDDGIAALITDGDCAGFELTFEEPVQIVDNMLPDSWQIYSYENKIVAFSFDGESISGGEIFQLSESVNLIQGIAADWHQHKVGITPGNLLQDYRLDAPFPNPFNPVTQINYHLEFDTMVNITIVDLLGRPVADLVQNYQTAGSYSLEWKPSGLASGIYLVVLETQGYQQYQKVMLLK